MRLSTVVAALTPVVAVYAAQITVTVGASQGLTFQPSSVTAQNGDIILFQFQAKNHTATQSTFAAPCTSSGVDSGFQPVPAGTTNFPQWNITINNASAPLWFYCQQAGHCQKGMVFAVNPTPAKTFQAFQQAAMAAPASSPAPSAASGSAATGAAAGGDPAASITGVASAQSTQKSNAMRLGGGAASSIALAGAIIGLLL